jgi:hypothetical protein
LLNISEAYGVVRQWDEALHAAQECLAIRRSLGNDARTASALRTVAAIQCACCDLASAVAGASESVELSRIAGDQLCEHLGVLTRCEAYIRRGWYADALSDADGVLSLARLRGDRYTEALALRQQSKIYAGLGGRERAAQLNAAASEVLARNA